MGAPARAAHRAEAVLEDALATVLRTGPRGVPTPRLTVAGRTDAGVHARGQVAHVDVDADALAGGPRARSTVPRSTRSSPGSPGCCRRPRGAPRRRVAPDGFDARFSAAAPPLHATGSATTRPRATRSRARHVRLAPRARSTSRRCRRRPRRSSGCTTSRRTASRARARRRSARSRSFRWSRDDDGPGGRRRAGRRVLPLDGALARRREPGRGGGAPRRRVAGRRCSRAAAATPGRTSRPRTGSRSRRSPTRPDAGDGRPRGPDAARRPVGARGGTPPPCC